jgi:hypothetical protein
MKVESLMLEPKIWQTLTLSISNRVDTSGSELMQALAISYEKKSASLGIFAPMVAFNPLAT